MLFRSQRRRDNRPHRAPPLGPQRVAYAQNATARAAPARVRPDPDRNRRRRADSLDTHPGRPRSHDPPPAHIATGAALRSDAGALDGDQRDPCCPFAVAATRAVAPARWLLRAMRMVTGRDLW